MLSIPEDVQIVLKIAVIVMDLSWFDTRSYLHPRLLENGEKEECQLVS